MEKKSWFKVFIEDACWIAAVIGFGIGLLVAGQLSTLAALIF